MVAGLSAAAADSPTAGRPVRSVANVAISAGPIAPPTCIEVLARMSDRPCESHLDHRGEHPPFTLMFAGDIALALVLARHAADEKVARQQFEITSDGAVALAQG